MALPSQVPTRAPREPSIRTDVSMVLVPVTVMDRRGATVTGLEKEQFTVFEDKIPQPIVSFTREEAPSSVGLIFDISGSMKSRMQEARSATEALFKTANPADEAFFMTIATRPEMLTDFTRDLGGIQSSIQFVRPGGRTALIDGVYLALERMRRARNPRKALVVISDGMDNHSRYSKAELMSRAIESDVQIYTIAVYDPPRSKKPIELQEERRGIFLLDDVALATGGLRFTVRTLDEVGPMAEKISTALRNQYVLGYHPPENLRPEKWHKIQVKLKVPNLRLYARAGYYGSGR